MGKITWKNTQVEKFAKVMGLPSKVSIVEIAEEKDTEIVTDNSVNQLNESFEVEPVLFDGIFRNQFSDLEIDKAVAKGVVGESEIVVAMFGNQKLGLVGHRFLSKK